MLIHSGQLSVDTTQKLLDRIQTKKITFNLIKTKII